MAAGPHGMTGAEAEARRRIAERGPITFAEFMEIALYWPDGGYYTTGQPFGADGDFTTAPLTHPVFGALLARQLLTLWLALGRTEPFGVLEAGAGTGRLAADIVAHAPLLDSTFGAALTYRAFDRRPSPLPSSTGSPSLPLRAVMPPAPSEASPTPAGSGGNRVVLANELIDAMPVHRVSVDIGELREVYVEASPDGGFVEALGAPSTPALTERLAAVGARLSEGCRAEVNLGLREWTGWAFGAIASGYLLLIDYGHEAAAYYDESRRRGTLRCYAGHTVGMDPYARVGRQDIGAHVEFTSLRAAARAAGFAEAGSMSQGELLRGLGLDAYRRQIAERPDLGRAARRANLERVDALASPDGMGSFRALLFAKDAPAEGLLGAASGSAGPAPLPGAGHLPVPGASPAPTWEELLR